MQQILYHWAKEEVIYAKYIMQNARLDESEGGIKISRRNINNLRYSDDTNLMAESEEELKSLLKLKEDSEKAGLKFNIQKTKIIASSPITSWQIDVEKAETATDFIFILFYFLGLQMVTAAIKLKDACSLEEKLWQT